jgi:hypothetical protein
VLAVLTPAQKTKLPALTEALQLQSTAWQAIELGMIDNPNVPDIRMLPIPPVPMPIPLTAPALGASEATKSAR